MLSLYSKMSRISKRFYRSDSVHNLSLLDRGETAASENKFVFEISHEAANKGDYLYLFVNLSVSTANHLFAKLPSRVRTSQLSCNIVSR